VERDQFSPEYPVMKKQFIVGHFIPLLIGGFIYILFRTRTLKMFSWFDDIGLLNQIDLFRIYTYQVENKIPNWILFSLPLKLTALDFIDLVVQVAKT